MPNDQDKKNNNSQNEQGSSSGRKSNISSTYHKCSDPRSKFSVHSVEANREIADACSGYTSRPWNQDSGNSK
ncbi:hypothetical protein [Wolbachia endosymbiont (group E) of Neria commutata]|uniref:hypothetical protein n=1 Tax=Wolbachia endosymbiont (group E) of Neria commutata TaxID=3066149 RepID=UPI00313349A3